MVSTALFLILTRPGISGAAAGFILVFAGAITWNVNWMLINLRQFELKGVSLERTSEYRLLEKEDGQVLNPHGEGYIFDDETQTTSWPTHGSIQVKNLQASYGPDLPNILHGVSFDVQGGQRVGIVGATGGGKSTLAKAFFSFVDVTGGKIEIDGKGESYCIKAAYSQADECQTSPIFHWARSARISVLSLKIRFCSVDPCD